MEVGRSEKVKSFQQKLGEEDAGSLWRDQSVLRVARVTLSSFLWIGREGEEIPEPRKSGQTNLFCRLTCWALASVGRLAGLAALFLELPQYYHLPSNPRDGTQWCRVRLMTKLPWVF